MNDDFDDDFDQPAKRIPALPDELKRRLFDYSNPDMPAIRYDAIGPEKWPASVAYGAKSGFTTWRNPSANDVRIHLNLGPDAQLHIGFEMGLVPAQFRIPRDRATELIKLGQALRREYNSLIICIPAGQTLALPAVYDSAIRTVRQGTVVAGSAPFLVKVVDGADETDPPSLHPALVSVGGFDDLPPMPSAAARRRS
ncbi:MAG TPA: hypothetical protein VHP33_28095 [Polyangiaceae bacterium]|nr:hypothetical protein [Polyangiaceae bacterium]